MELGRGAPEQSVDCAERDGVLVATVAGKAAPLDPDDDIFMLDLETVIDRIERLAEDERFQAALRAARAHATAPWLVHADRLVPDVSARVPDSSKCAAYLQ